MFESAKTLQAICFDFICTNFYEISEVFDVHELLMGARCVDRDCLCIFGRLPEHDRVRFKYNKTNVWLPSHISEPLLARISKNRSFSDCYLMFFDSQTTKLKHVVIKNATQLYSTGLEILKQHDIVDLEVNKLRMTIDVLIECLNDWTLQNLRSLSVARPYDRSLSFLALTNLPALQALNVSFTEFNNKDLEMVVENLQKLESIDISGTKVDNITPLKKCKDRLKTLVMSNLKENTYDNAHTIFLEMNELRTLDVSKPIVPGEYVSEPSNFLKAVDIMPHLINLDMSGIDIDHSDLSKFIQAHPRLSYLGLLGTNADYMESLVNPSHPDFRPDLRVAGLEIESQIIESLKRYSDRWTYLEHCLRCMGDLAEKGLKTKLADVIKLIIPIMQLHRRISELQIYAVKCLYILTKKKRASQIHPSILQQTVDVVLSAMDEFPTCSLIYINALKMISNHRILCSVSFDKIRCAVLLIQSLCQFSDKELRLDPRMDVLALQIITNLLPTMSISETSKVGSTHDVIHKLLSYIKIKGRYECEYGNMELATRGLRHLTNESIESCRIFLQEGGMKIYLEILKHFPKKRSFNIIGIFNNISKFGELRQPLMVPEFMKMLPLLMERKRIRVSYQAAGVAANLLSDGPQIWTDDPSMPSKTEIHDELAKTVNNWIKFHDEIVDYPSFKPLLKLLRATEPYPVQLWAAWVIRHAYDDYPPKHYCEMLRSEKGDEILKSLEKDNENGTHPNVRALCRSILDTLALYPSYEEF